MHIYTRNELHQKILSRIDNICHWFSQKADHVKFPIYSSYDVRDAGYKVSNVDANIYPAGFNNICPTDKESAVDIMDSFLKSTYGSKVDKIALITEEHTQNPYYWDNIHTIKELIETSGKKVRVAFPKKLDNTLHL
ncbi:MAG: glutamate--cysteine ligase, partial [Bdellovibrionales bacterium]|nr:glutamate--cysteine ligase [Bdellovibrionales bacterium]